MPSPTLGGKHEHWKEPSVFLHSANTLHGNRSHSFMSEKKRNKHIKKHADNSKAWNSGTTENIHA